MIYRFLFLILFYIQLQAQVFSDYSFSTAETSALAGAAVASKGTTSSLFNNPASLVELNNKSVSFGYSNLYNQSYLPLTTIGLSIPYKKNISIGVKYSSLKVDYRGNQLSNEQTYGIIISKYMLNDKNSTLSIGISLNNYSVEFGRSAGSMGNGSDGIAKESVAAYGVDIGVLATLREKNRLAVFIKNVSSSEIGAGTSNQDLPKRIDLGFSTIPFDELFISFSMQQLLGYEKPHLRSGLSYKINKLFQINAGVQINPNRFGVGFNLEKNKIIFSYGYLTHHVLPGTHQTNLGISF